MVEELQKIKVSELARIRIAYADGMVHEMPTKAAESHRAKSDLQDFNDKLNALAEAISYFSHEGAAPAVEFVIPFKR